MGDVSTVRTAIVTAVDALAGWAHSRYAPEFFGADSDQLQHHAFAVGMVSSEPRDGRQSLTDGCLVATTVEVRWAHRLRADAQSSDYGAALDAEQELVAAVVGIASQHVLLTRLTRAARAEGWVLGVATFTAWHRYTLQ